MISYQQKKIEIKHRFQQNKNKTNQNSEIIQTLLKKNKNEKYSLCGCMIVKNEAHIIHESLNTLLPYIDCWCISDTGSTDGTQDIIKQFFADHHVPGYLVQTTWPNHFGKARSAALDKCYGLSHFVFMFDADDIIHGNITIPDWKNLEADAFKCRFGGGEFAYWRLSIFRNDGSWRYEGILHEFPTNGKIISEQKIEILEGDYYIDSRRLGARSKQADKYLKDAQTLLKEHGKNPDDKRTIFYLAVFLFVV